MILPKRIEISSIFLERKQNSEASQRVFSTLYIINEGKLH